LALLYNAPRQATIRCDSEAVLFSLDRETYRYIIAQSSAVRDLEIKKALSKVPILIDLTEEQLDRLADSVETFPYKPGMMMIRMMLMMMIIVMMMMRMMLMMMMIIVMMMML